MTFVAGLIVMLLLAAPIVALQISRSRSAGKLEELARAQGFELKVGPISNLPYATSVVSGRRVMVQQIGGQSSWTVYVAIAPPPVGFALLRRDFKRGWSDRIPFGPEATLDDANLARRFVFRSKDPEAAERLVRRPDLGAALRDLPATVYSIHTREEETEFEYRGPTLCGTVWYGAFSAADPAAVPPAIAAFVAIAELLDHGPKPGELPA